MNMDKTIEYSVSGSEAAKLAWDIRDITLAYLVSSQTPVSFYQDIRSHFALWLSTQPRKIFPSMTEAWNIFVQPKLKFKDPVILLPGSICDKCSSVKYRTKNFNKIGYDKCVQCKGTGRKPPRAIFASLDDSNLITKDFIPQEKELETTIQSV